MGLNILEKFDNFEDEKEKIDILSRPSNFELKKDNRLERYKNLAEKNSNSTDCEASAKAAYYKGKINTINNSKVIFSDDPEAIEKLETKILLMEEKRDFYKKVNKDYKKLKNIDLLKYLLPEQKSKIISNLKFHEYSKPFPQFYSANLSQNIRTAKKRLEILIKKSKDITKEESIGGINLVDNVEINRLQIFFKEIPNSDIRKELKSSGFRWAPSINCWQAFRSNKADYQAKRIINLCNQN